MSRRKQLKMKPVGVKHLEQYNQLLRYVFQVTDRELHQTGWEDEEIMKTKFPVLQRADVLGWFDGDKLISQVAVYPFQVRIFDRTYDMGGLTGVGTYPEYSNQGLMHKLLYKALENMRNKKQSISYLSPTPSLTTAERDGRSSLTASPTKSTTTSCRRTSRFPARWSA